MPKKDYAKLYREAQQKLKELTAENEILSSEVDRLKRENYWLKSIEKEAKLRVGKWREQEEAISRLRSKYDEVKDRLVAKLQDVHIEAARMCNCTPVEYALCLYDAHIGNIRIDPEFRKFFLTPGRPWRGNV